MRYLLVLLGGAAGSVARYALGMAFTERFGATFPFGTIAINITGSFLIGLVMTLLTEHLPSDENLRPLLVTGVLGGFTTFSAFEWETYNLGLWAGLANVIGSVAFGYAAVWLGYPSWSQAGGAENPRCPQLGSEASP